MDKTVPGRPKTKVPTPRAVVKQGRYNTPAYHTEEGRPLACADCIFHFEPVSLKAAFDSANCSNTASGVNREIGMPNVVLVCGEMNRTIDSIRSGIPSKKPTNLPPPASTIEDASASLSCTDFSLTTFLCAFNLGRRK